MPLGGYRGANNEDLLQKLLHEVSNQHILLMGDFNYKDIDWVTTKHWR